MNTIVIAGHLGGDPESRFTPSGTKVTTFNVASNIRVSGQDVTMWYRVVVWGERFDNMITHLKKGSPVIASGELRRSEWTDKEGRQQVTLEVHADSLKFSPFGRPNPDGAPRQAAAPGHQTEKREKVYEFAGQTTKESNTEDDLPF